MAKTYRRGQWINYFGAKYQLIKITGRNPENGWTIWQVLHEWGWKDHLELR